MPAALRLVLANVLAPALALILAGLPSPAVAQAPEVLMYEDPSLGPDRPFYPLLISEGRGYRIRCASDEAENAVIRGLGFATVPSRIVSALDPLVAGADPGANPFLCPAAPEAPIGVFAHDGGDGLTHYMQFPNVSGASDASSRLFVPGCAGLFEALNLDSAVVQNADPRPFFQDRIHEIACLEGVPLDPEPETFAGWCTKGDRSPEQTATVMALLAATPGGVGALGDAAACQSAEDFLSILTTLILDGRGVADLAPLATLQTLTSLTLSNNAIADITPLAGLTQLTFLDLSGNGIVNLAPLAPLVLLTQLDLADNDVDDIRALSAMPQLTRLDLGGNRITELDPLQFHPVLAELSLAGNGLTGTDIEPLTALGALTSLDLSNNEIATIDELGNFPSTLEIDLTGNPVVQQDGQSFAELCILNRDAATTLGQTIRVLIETGGGGSCAEVAATLSLSNRLDLTGKVLSDLRPLAMLPHLTELILSDNAITDIAPLAALDNLHTLILDGNAITDITPIGGLTLLTSFDAADNPVVLDRFLAACIMRNQPDTLTPAQIAETDALHAVSGEQNCAAAEHGLQRMTAVDLSGSGLGTLAYISVLQGVQSLGLADNPLTDPRPLAELPALSVLDLQNTPLTDVSGLSGLTGLNTLRLDGSPLATLNGIHALGRLRHLSFSNTQVRQVRQLAALPQLEHATMRNLPLTYGSFEEYCIVQRFDPIALFSNRAVMEALVSRMVAASVDPDDCDAARRWATDLDVLTLNKKSITGIAPLRFFTNLTELHLFDNFISDVGPVAGLRQLEKLNLAKNTLSSIPRFQSPVLRQLFLNDNRLSSVANLSNHNALNNVGLRNNRLTSITPLLSINDLRVSDVRDNRLDELDDIGEALLPKIYLGDNPICSSIFMIHPEVANACEREPSRFVINHDLIGGIGDIGLAVNPDRINLDDCVVPGCRTPVFDRLPHIHVDR